MEASSSTVSVTVVCAVVVVVAVAAWLLRRANEWWYVPSAIPAGLKLPPGSLGWPFVGDMFPFVHHFKRDPEAYFQRQFLSQDKENSDGIYKAHLFGNPCIITCTPEMNKFVLGSHMEGTAFTSGWPTPDVMGASCMVVVEGAQHKRMRRLITEAVSHPLALRKSLLRLEKRFTNTLAQWAQEKNIVLRERLKQVAFEEICDSFLSLTPGPLVKKMMGFTQGLVAGVRAFPINIPGFSYHESLQCRKGMMEIMFSIIKNRRSAGVKAEDDDFLDVLLRVQDDQGNRLTDNEISDNIVSFLLAGHESTSYTILWTMIHLAKNPKIWNKLRDEHVTLQTKKEGDWLSDLKKTPYTNLVLNEVLRLVNIAPFVFRSVQQDGVNYKGYYFPKGWKIIAWVRASHMNPSIYTDPHTFNPERFSDPPQASQYMPFGYGPRVCPGNTLALLAARMFIHTLVTNYKWSFVNPNAKVTYLPHPKPVDGGEVVFEHL